MPLADYAIVGGGISGLVIAALLTKAGKTVELYEKNSTIGGYFHNISTSEVPYGAHHLGIPSAGLIKDIFDLLGIDLIKRMVEASDITVILGDESYQLSLKLPELEKGLIKYFPHEKGNIISFIRYVRSFSEVLLDGNEEVVKKKFIETVFISFDEYLINYFEDKKLRRILTMLGPGYGGVNGSDSAFTFISLLATYGKGSYYFDDYGIFLIQALKEIISQGNPDGIKEGNAIINIEKNEDYFLFTTQQGERYVAKNVILACYPMKFIDCISKKMNVKNGQLNKIKRLTVGPSAYRFYFKVNKAIDTKEYIYIPPCDCDSKKNLLDDYFIMSAISNEIGKINVMITFIVENVNNEETINRRIDEVRTYISKIYNIGIEDIECSINISPENREAATWNKNGSVFGWKRNTENNLNTNLIESIDRYLPGVFVVGHWSSTFGIFGSIFTAIKCFNKILRK